MTLLLQKLLPIIIIIIIGAIIRRKQLLCEQTIDGLKTIIIKIALPAVLFTAFSKTDFKLAYLLLFLIIFLFCSLLYFIGEVLHRKFPKNFNYTYSSGYFTGFEFGMIGVGLFSAIWGIDKLPVIMLIGFGHELFIWFVYVPLIKLKGNEKFTVSKTFIEFIKTPTILAIILGTIFNLTGLYNILENNILGSSIFATIDFLMPLTTPLILIIIGYSLTLKKLNLSKIFVYIGIRTFFVLSIGSFVLFLLLKIIPTLDSFFVMAFYAFILLPAPYILPLYIEDKKEAEFFSQFLVYSTIVTFVGNIILLIVSL